jgi:hypothetical protein
MRSEAPVHHDNLRDGIADPRGHSFARSLGRIAEAPLAAAEAARRTQLRKQGVPLRPGGTCSTDITRSVSVLELSVQR